MASPADGRTAGSVCGGDDGPDGTFAGRGQPGCLDSTMDPRIRAWTGDVSKGDRCSSPGERRSGARTGPFGQHSGGKYRSTPISLVLSPLLSLVLSPLRSVVGARQSVPGYGVKIRREGITRTLRQIP